MKDKLKKINADKVLFAMELIMLLHLCSTWKLVSEGQMFAQVSSPEVPGVTLIITERKSPKAQ